MTPTPFLGSRITRLLAAGLALASLAALVACTPMPPRFGNFGGPFIELPDTPPAKPAAGFVPETDWFPVQARFHPDGKRLVLNFCRGDAPYYCRMVQYDIAARDWRLLPNQEDGVSYFRPSYSNDGRTLVFSQAPCSPDRKQCNDGYGQLATMAAEGGPIRLLPVGLARRAHFTADDRRLTFWRIKTTGKLASGRPIGSVSVYEYDLASGEETPLIESMESAPGKPYGVRFIADLTAPRYTVDGKTLFFCALNDETYLRDPVTQQPLVHPVPGWAANCFFYDRGMREYTLINTDRMGLKLEKRLGTPYLQHPRLGYLTAGGLLQLKDSSTWVVRQMLMDTGRIQRADADINRQGDTAVAVTGTTAFKNGAHEPRRAYYAMQWHSPMRGSDPPTYTREAPVLALINVDTHAVTPLEWPDIARLPVINKP